MNLESKAAGWRTLQQSVPIAPCKVYLGVGAPSMMTHGQAQSPIIHFKLSNLRTQASTNLVCMQHRAALPRIVCHGRFGVMQRYEMEINKHSFLRHSFFIACPDIGAKKHLRDQVGIKA